jgi:hypothetical protein
MKYVVAIPKIVLLVVTIVTLALFTSIYPIIIPWKPVFASPDTLTLRPNAAGTYQNWETFGAPPSHWEGTSDQNDVTGVQSPAGDTTAKETENLQDTSQTGTIHSVTAYMRAKSTGSDSNTTIFSDGFEAGNFALWTDGGTTTWVITSAQKHSGTYSATCGSANDGALTSDNIDVSGATSIYLSFWIRDDDLDNSDGYLYYYDNTGSYDQILDLNSLTPTEDQWTFYSTTITDSQYFHSTFRIRFNETPENGENCWIDDVTVNKIISGDEQAVILWRTYDTDYESSTITISRTAFTDYSEARTTNPNSDQAWTWTEINALQIGSRASTLGSGETIQVSEYWIVVDYTLGFNLNLRVRNWDLTDNIQGAYVYKDSDVQISDANGWANWTLVSGTVQIKVSYYGFWVNGTFSVTMDFDKTIDVQCKLYDVTVLVQESVQNATLAGANVTVYNSTSVQGNKITSGVTGNNGQVQLLNLPNNTLTFTQYGGASYSLVIGNTTQLVWSENQNITLTANQNNISTNSYYSIIAFIGVTIPLKGSFIRGRLKKKRRAYSKVLEKAANKLR